jgi:hypothetical protein
MSQIASERKPEGRQGVHVELPGLRIENREFNLEFPGSPRLEAGKEGCWRWTEFGLLGSQGGRLDQTC